MRNTQLEKRIVLDGTKLQWHRERLDAWKHGEKVAPITIDCSLTRACNYRCSYCYGKLQKNDIMKMTEKVLFDFLDDAREIGVKGISCVSDGESTMSPHLVSFIQHAHNIGLDIALGTNGYRLTQKQIDLIVPKLTYLRFNISAGEPKAYAKIHGVPADYLSKVQLNIMRAREIKKRVEFGYLVGSKEMTLGIQMVLVPGQNEDQILPLAELGRSLGVDYFVIKHCSDDEKHTLGVDYEKYFKLEDLLKQAEALSTADYLVRAKWSKILSHGERDYDKCYAPALIMQFSGSGLVAPCGMLFNDRFKDKFHIGNIGETRFKKMFESKRYDEVLKRLASKEFNPKTACGSLCLQHKCNETMFAIKHKGFVMKEPEGEPPMHINFI